MFLMCLWGPHSPAVRPPRRRSDPQLVDCLTGGDAFRRKQD